MEELKKDVVVLLGAGQIGMAIIRRVGYGKHVVIADLNLDYANEAAKTLYNAGFEVSSMQADLRVYTRINKTCHKFWKHNRSCMWCRSFSFTSTNRISFKS